MYFRKLNAPNTVVSDDFIQKSSDLETQSTFNTLDFRISNIEIIRAIKGLKMIKISRAGCSSK